MIVNKILNTVYYGSSKPRKAPSTMVYCTVYSIAGEVKVVSCHPKSNSL